MYKMQILTKAIKFAFLMLAQLWISGCSTAIIPVVVVVVVDLDRLPKADSKAVNPSGSDSDTQAKLDEILSDQKIPKEFHQSLSNLAIESNKLDKQLQDRAQKHKQDFMKLCDSILRRPEAELNHLEKEWLESQKHVPMAASTVDCVFYRYHYATTLFIKGGRTHNNFYIKYQNLPLMGLVRRLAKNPISYHQERLVQRVITIDSAYHELARTRDEFTYCIYTAKNCTPRIVKRRATIVFTKDQRPVETLHLLDELQTRNAFGAGMVLRQIAVYSENAQEHLTTIEIGEDFGKIREAMGYAMPREIVYVREGRVALQLSEAALGEVHRAMLNLPTRF